MGYAYSRWDVHQSRSYRYGRPWGVSVQVYVTDPFWRPWGPYWSYDPWGWYWDGFRDGRNGRGWGSRGGIGWSGPGVRTVWTDGRVGWGRHSPLGPAYKEDPADRRTAVPHAGRAVPVAAPGVADPIGRGLDEPRTAATSRPSGDGGRVARPGSDGATPRPTDGLRGAGRARPEATPEGADAGDHRR
ncbi:MAG: hypothetical protein EXR95_04085 [Gemmatimonadetes bacterium]|nr:hypothetical protein [Gemmatimonadota bacterium]